LTKFDGFEPRVPDWFRRLESERPEHVRSTRFGVLTPERVVGAETGSCPPPLCATTRVAGRRARVNGKAVRARLKDGAAPPFRYHDKGSLATIGRAAAVGDIKDIKLRDPMTGARKEPVVFVELDTRQDAGYTVSLESERETDETQIILAGIRDESLLVLPVPGANAGDAFRHPFRHAP
jgi:hypothetical protein